MKKILLLAALVFGISAGGKAQMRVNINIGAPVAQQSWYDYDDDYYYLPDPGVYYNVRRRVYVYPEGGTWVYAPALPSRYGGCSYGNSRFYRIHDRAPFYRNDYYRNQYRVTYNNGYREGYRHDNSQHRGWHKHDRGYDNRYNERDNDAYRRDGYGYNRHDRR